jgi:hypothetical protein
MSDELMDFSKEIDKHFEMADINEGGFWDFILSLFN